MPPNCEGIDFAENRYYRINRIFLSMLNLWPYHQSKYSKIIHMIYFGIMFSFMLFQLTSFFTFKLTIDFVITVLSYAIPSLVYIVHYYSFYSKPTAIKRIWQDIHDSWNLVKNGEERSIMQQHSSAGELYTILIFLGIAGSFTLYVFIELLPTILDIIFPLNETRPREIHAVTEYFVDERTYYYLILCHWLTGIFFGGCVVIATGTLELVYMEHICGLFSIASYRIQHSIDQYASHNSIQKKNCAALQNIRAAVDVHRRAHTCCEFMVTTFAPTFCVIVVIGVSSLSLNLFRLIKAIILRNMNELISSIIFVNMHFIYMFIVHYNGQKITDHNNEIFKNAYSIQWYTIPVEIQKLLLFIIQNTTKAYIINIGNLLMASIEDFSKLVSTSISYFTLIYSLL